MGKKKGGSKCHVLSRVHLHVFICAAVCLCHDSVLNIMSNFTILLQSVPSRIQRDIVAFIRNYL